MSSAYNIYRFYRPAWGRYSQRDPIGLSLGGSYYGLNHLYAYAADNPLSSVDPSGLIAVSPSCDEPAKLLIDEAVKTINKLDFSGCSECGFGFSPKDLKKKLANMTVHCFGKEQGYYKVPKEWCGVPMKPSGSAPWKLSFTGADVSVTDDGLFDTCGCLAKTLVHEAGHLLEGMKSNDAEDQGWKKKFACLEGLVPCE